MSHVDAIGSPFSCRWIQRGTERRISNLLYALCVRVPAKPHIVSELECARCARWEGPDDDPNRGRGE